MSRGVLVVGQALVVARLAEVVGLQGGAVDTVPCPAGDVERREGVDGLKRLGLLAALPAARATQQLRVAELSRARD